jgi:hypothetical protein
MIKKFWLHSTKNWLHGQFKLFVFPDRCFLPNDKDLLYGGTNIFVRNKKNDV